MNTWRDGEISAGGDIHQALVGASRAEGDRSHPGVPGTANSASPTNSSSNASEQSSSYYNRPPRLSTNGTFEGGEHNSSSGYGSSAEAQVGHSLHEVIYILMMSCTYS